MRLASRSISHRSAVLVAKQIQLFAVEKFNTASRSRGRKLRKPTFNLLSHWSGHSCIGRKRIRVNLVALGSGEGICRRSQKPPAWSGAWRDPLSANVAASNSPLFERGDMLVTGKF